MSKQYPGGLISKNPVVPSGPYQNSSASGVWTLDQQAYWAKQNLWPTAGLFPSEPYFNYVTMLLHGNGVNGAQNNTFLDSSTNNFTITRNGNTTQGTFTPYGSNWSNYFNGAQSLSFANNAAFSLASSAFTVEAWVNFDSVSGSRAIVGNYGSGSTGWTLQVDGGVLKFYRAGDTLGIAGTTTIVAGVWYHFAVSGTAGTSMKLFVNGVQEGSTSTGNITDSSAATSVGQIFNVNYLAGSVSNVRIVKGTALYTSNFTPSTTPLTAVSGTSLLTCQANRFIDSSANAFTCSLNGSPIIQRINPFAPTQQTPVSYSGYFDGSGDYITAPSNAAFDFGSGDFTIEMWVNPSSHPSETLPISRVYDGAGNYSFAAYFTSGTVRFLYNGLTTISTSTVLSLYTWSHIAYVRSGTTLTIYVNGVSAGSGTISGSITASSYAVGVGARYDGSFPFVGGVSNARIVKGTAVYTGAFTPPTTPLTAISGTSLLTCQSTTFIDNSANAFTITVAGNARPFTANPFGVTTTNSAYSTSVIGGSGYFDGSGDQLTVANNSAFDVGSGNFTVEAWVYLTSTSGSVFNYSNGQTQNSNFAWEIYQLSATSIQVFVAQSTSQYVASSTALVPNAWNHVAGVRNGNTLTIYVNGVAGGTTASVTGVTVNNPASSTVKVSGYNNSTNNIAGYVTDARMVKGTAVYTANFTPPTAPLTAITNTQLLTNFTNAGIFDNAMMNDLETVGNAQISTAVKKYGTGSMYFDGSGDWLQAPLSQPFNFGTNSFTIEMWVNPSTTNHQSACFFTQQHIAASNTPISICIYLNGGNYEVVGNGLGWGIYSGGAWQVAQFNLATIPINTWTFIALVRNGNVFTMYVNGTSVGSVTNSSSCSAGSTPYFLGRRWDLAGSYPYYNGYIDDFRITRGVARYTSNFTPPTSQFFDQ
jgi:hypothetical protein